MGRSYRFARAALIAAPLVVGALHLAPAAEKREDVEKKISQALAQLPRADRVAAETQRYCAVQTGHRLGSMGAPVSVELDGQKVFVCCKGCVKRAAANTQATLGAVKKLRKAAASLAKLPPEDRGLAEAQRFCAVEEKNLLGTMGKPVKLLINGQPVFLCCAGCEKAAKAHPRETLAKVKELKAAK